MLLLLAACADGPTPEETDVDIPEPLVEAGPRTLDFERVTDLGNGRVLDLDLSVDGRDAAVIHPSGSRGEVWLRDAGGWRLLLSVDERLPTCVAIEPGGDRVLVGAYAGTFWVLRDDGTVLRDRHTYDGMGALPSRQCVWDGLSQLVGVSFSADSGIDGGVLVASMANPEFLTWRPQVPDLTDSSTNPLWSGTFAADALALSTDRNTGTYVSAGVAYGLPLSPDESVVSGHVDLSPWSQDPIQSDFAPGWGRPRVWGGYPGKGGVILYRRPVGSYALVSGPVGTYGLGELTAAGASGTFFAADIDADGFLWLGGDQGLFRSTEVVR